MASKFDKRSLCVIIPMHNEEKGAAQCIDAVLNTIKTLPLKTKLIIVNDGSIDSTKHILTQKQKKYRSQITIVNHILNRGYGKALQNGIQEALKQNFEYGIFMDSDLTNNPAYIVDFLKEIPKNYDCVKASRYTKGGSVLKVPFKKQIISVLGNTLASFCFNLGIKDCTNGFRMIKLSKLKNVRFHENSFPIILEELYVLKRMNAKCKEIPYILTSRKFSTSHFTYTPKIFFSYLKYCVKALFV